MLFFFASVLFITTLLGLVVPSLRKKLYTGFKRQFDLISATLHSSERKGTKGNEADILQISENNKEEVEQSKQKLVEIENEIIELKTQANQVKFSYRLAIVQLIETLQMLEKSLQEDRVALATLETQ